MVREVIILHHLSDSVCNHGGFDFGGAEEDGGERWGTVEGSIPGGLLEGRSRIREKQFHLHEICRCQCVENMPTYVQENKPRVQVVRQ